MTLSSLRRLITAAFLLLPASLWGQNNYVLGNIGGQYTDEMEIHVQADGQLVVKKWEEVFAPEDESSAQIYTVYSGPILAIKIGNETFCTYNPAGAYSPLTPIDIGSTMQDDNYDMQRNFRGSYQGNPFQVIWQIHYINKKAPNVFFMRFEVNATYIPAGTPISVAYGGESFINNSPYASAFTSPNVTKSGTPLNGSNTGDWAFSTAEVQGLNIVAATNLKQSSQHGDRRCGIGFEWIDQPFDRASSAAPSSAHPGEFLKNGVGNTFNYTESTPQGIAVANDVPAGEISQIIQTRWRFFNPSFNPAQLVYVWGGIGISSTVVGNTIRMMIPMGNPAFLMLSVLREDYLFELKDIGFRVNMPEGLPHNGVLSHEWFNNTATLEYDNPTYFRLSNGVMTPGIRQRSLALNIPTPKYGEWVLDKSNFELTNLEVYPGYDSMVLVVTTEIGFPAGTPAPAGVAPGGSHTYTVKLPDGVTADRDFTVYLSYTGATSAFDAPPTMTIPQGANSGTFTVTAKSGATNGASMTASLDTTNYSFILIGANKEATIQVDYALRPALSQPANQILCTGTQTAPVNFAGTNIDPALCTWTAINGAAIGLSDSGTGNIPAFTALARGRTQTATFTVSHPGAEAKEFTVTVSPCVVPVNPHLRSRVY
jgi:hypothetical protein